MYTTRRGNRARRVVTERAQPTPFRLPTSRERHQLGNLAPTSGPSPQKSRPAIAKPPEESPCPRGGPSSHAAQAKPQPRIATSHPQSLHRRPQVQPRPQHAPTRATDAPSRPEPRQRLFTNSDRPATSDHPQSLHRRPQAQPRPRHATARATGTPARPALRQQWSTNSVMWQPHPE